MSIDELLLPRYKVTADYPDSEFQVGEILLQCRDGIRLVSLTRNMYLDWFKIDKYPHLFKKLEWWEYRTIEQLQSIKYMKVVEYHEYWIVGDVVPVTSIDFKENGLARYYLSGHIHPLHKIQPATEDEYIQWKENELTQTKDKP